ncbi:MAG: autotransporter-associated beta strand repeat-containing protein [Verrucomicrobia bacterium]|nr:autotransporter-associated beta strand repeat-containing protein [Verrucomicrobiota bacterium]
MKLSNTINDIRVHLKHLALAAALGASFLAASAQAATLTWNLAGNGNWDTATANWTGDATTFISDGSQDVIFNNTANATVTVSAGMQPNSTTVNNSAGTLQFSTGAITGTGGLTKSGAGILRLNAQNSFTGKTIIQGGQLQLRTLAYLSNAGVNGGLGAPPAGANAVIDIYNGGILRVGGGSPRVNQSTDRTINLAGDGTGTMNIRVDDNDAIFQFGAFTATGTGPKTLALMTAAGGSGDREVMTIAGVISDGPDVSSPLTLQLTSNQGDENYMNFPAANTFTGPITLSRNNARTIIYLTIGGVRQQVGRNYNGTTGASTPGTGSLGGGNYAGSIALCASSTLTYYSSAAQNLAGAISGPGALQVASSGILTLSGANTYSGNTTVDSGSSLVLAPAGSLNFVLGNTTTNKLTGAGTAKLDGKFTIDTSAVTSYTGSWTLADITTKTYSSDFGVTGFTKSGTAHTFTDAQFRTWTFEETTSVLSVAAPALITSFGVSLPGGSATVIDQATPKTIHVYVPTGTAVNSLAPTYTLTSGTCDHDNGVTAYDFSTPVTYKVTDVATTTVNDYVVTVSTTPLPLLGLRVWLKADAVNAADPAQVDGSSNVLKWIDQSGNGNHATKGSAPIAPTYVASTLNGQPVLRFTQTGDDTGSRLYLGDLSAQFSVAANGSSVYAAATIGTPTTPTDGRYNMFGNRANDDRWVANSWSESSPGSFRGGRTSLPYASVPQTGSHIFSMESSSSAYRAVIDGTQIGSVGGDYNSGSGANWNIGNSAAANGQQLNGDIAELILYSRVLTADEANLVGGYLSGKYALTTEYPPLNATAPYNVKAVGGDKEVFLSWHSFPAATDYTVKRSTTPGGSPLGTYDTLASGITGTTYTDTTAVNGTTYYYVVSATVGAVETPNSAEVNGTPTGVNATLSTVANSLPSLWADGVSFSTVTVTLLNDFSIPMVGKEVTLTSSREATDTITGSPGLSDANGQVVFTVKSSTVGTADLTATDTTDTLTIGTPWTETFVASPTPLTTYLPSATVLQTWDFTDGTYQGWTPNRRTYTTTAGVQLGSNTPWNADGGSRVGMLQSPALPAGMTWVDSGVEMKFNTPNVAIPTSELEFLTWIRNDPRMGFSIHGPGGTAMETKEANPDANSSWAPLTASALVGPHTLALLRLADGTVKTYLDGTLINTMVGTTAPASAPDRLGIGQNEINGNAYIPIGSVISKVTAFNATAVAPGYAAWANQYAGGPTAPANDDYNNDGVRNGIAYFMGENGLATNPGVVNGKVSWPHVVQVSADLTTWVPANPDDVDTTGTPGHVIYTFPKVDPKEFCRLVVTP